MNVKEIRGQFPFLATKVYGKPLVYLDNAASSQRPLAVIQELEKLSQEANANIHRAVHFLAGQARIPVISLRSISTHRPGKRSFLPPAQRLPSTWLRSLLVRLLSMKETRS